MAEVASADATRNEQGNSHGINNLEILLTKKIEEAKAALDTSSLNSPGRLKRLDDLACALADKHTALRVQGPGDLPEAIEYAEQALEMCSEDHVHDKYDPIKSDEITIQMAFKNKGTISSTLQMIYGDLYDSTNEIEYLNKGIKHGKQAVDFLDRHHDKYPTRLWPALYGRRTNILAGLYKRRFRNSDPNVGDNEQDLDNAIEMQSRAAAAAPIARESYMNMGLFCDLMIVKAGVRNDVKYIDDALTLRAQRSRKVMFDRFEGPSARNNYYEYSMLLCRRWQMTGTEEDFSIMIKESRELVDYEIQRENCRPFFSDPTSMKDVLRMCALNIATLVEGGGTEWIADLPTLETGIALALKLIPMIPMGTGDNYEERAFPVDAAERLMERRWNITKNPAHGFAFDDMVVYSLQQNHALDSWREHGKLSTLSAVPITSVVSGQEMVVHDSPSLTVGTPRLIFLSPVKAENWIRKRNDDGTIDLSANKSDVDILDFLSRELSR